ncbi:MAG: hypothetical protein ACUVX9_15000 [Anaerolineae bacterium]
MREVAKAGAVGAAAGPTQSLRADGNLPLPHSTTALFRGKPVMRVVGDIAYRKADRGERLRKPEGWSFHESVLQQLEAAGVRQLVVEDQETGITYAVDWSAFLAKSFALDRGAGPQRALPMRYWRVVHGPAAWSPMPAGPVWQQANLFE